MEDVKDKVKYHYDELEEYSGKWVNFALTTVGFTPHTTIFDTKEAAKIFADLICAKTEAKIQKAGGTTKTHYVYSVATGKLLYWWSEFICFVQMPVGEK